MRISDWSSDVCSSDLEPGFDACAALFVDHRRNCHARARSGFWLPDVWRTVAEGGHGAFGAVRGKQAGFEARLSPSGHVAVAAGPAGRSRPRSEEHTSELQSLMRTSNAVFCLKKK